MVFARDIYAVYGMVWNFNGHKSTLLFGDIKSEKIREIVVVYISHFYVGFMLMLVQFWMRGQQSTALKELFLHGMDYSEFQ